MRKMFILILILGGFLYAADTNETKKEPSINDRNWQQVNFNLMYGQDMRGFGSPTKDMYLEIEIMGRKGIFDFYGYIDVHNILGLKSFSSANYTADNGENWFAELHPRLSISGLLNKEVNGYFTQDISLMTKIGDYDFGIKEWYFTNYLKSADQDLLHWGFGVGTDIAVPWLGTVGLNYYAMLRQEDFDSDLERKFAGHLIKTNWFKPLYFFEDTSFVAWQGYASYEFAANYSDSFRTSDELQWLNAIYYHRQNVAIGYSLKYMYNMIHVKDGETIIGNNSSHGVAHFFSVGYKF